MPASTTVLVEGESDRLAVLAAAHRLGRNLPAEDVQVVAMGGATNVIHFLDRLGPSGLGHRLLGLCDAAEARGILRAFARAGTRAATPQELGFEVCRADLEDELIRALEVDGVLSVIAERGELNSFRGLQRQPALRERSTPDQLRRFLGGRSGNKRSYAPLLVEAVPLQRIPMPLARLIAAI